MNIIQESYCSKIYMQVLLLWLTEDNHIYKLATSVQYAIHQLITIPIIKKVSLIATVSTVYIYLDQVLV